MVSLRERIAIGDWMNQYCSQSGLTRRTLYLAFDIFDNVINLTLSDLSIMSQTKQCLEGIALVCLFIASKLEEVKPPSIAKLSLSVRGFTLNELLDLERKVLTLLNFKLPTLTAFDHILVVLELINQNKKEQCLSNDSKAL